MSNSLRLFGAWGLQSALTYDAELRANVFSVSRSVSRTRRTTKLSVKLWPGRVATGASDRCLVCPTMARVREICPKLPWDGARILQMYFHSMWKLSPAPWSPHLETQRGSPDHELWDSLCGKLALLSIGCYTCRHSGSNRYWSAPRVYVSLSIYILYI